MTHRRQEIREHVETLLKDGLHAVDGNVFRSRAYPMKADRLPGVCVYTLSETSEQWNQSRALDRVMDLAIDIYVAHTDNPDDDLDDLAEAVEALIDEDHTFGKLALNSWLAETTIGFDGEGAQAHGLARLRYAVRYRTSN
ncbi:MAG: hypothetical protein AAF942_00075 [Pseudomonadota bacterium]